MQIPDFNSYITNSRRATQYWSLVSATRFIVEIALSSIWANADNSEEFQLTLRYRREKDDWWKRSEPRSVCFLKVRVNDDTLHILEYRPISDKHVTERVFNQFNVPKFFSDLVKNSFNPEKIIVDPFPEDDGEWSAHQIKYRQQYMQLEMYLNPEN